MSETEEQASVEKLALMLQAVGYRADVSEGYVSTSLAGRTVTVRWFEEESIQVAYAIRCPKPVPLEVLNEFHKNYRFGSAYADEHIVVLHSSFLLPELEAEEPSPVLLEAMTIFEGLMSYLNSMLAPSQEEIAVGE